MLGPTSLYLRPPGCIRPTNKSGVNHKALPASNDIGSHLPEKSEHKVFLGLLTELGRSFRTN